MATKTTVAKVTVAKAGTVLLSGAAAVTAALMPSKATTTVSNGNTPVTVVTGATANPPAPTPTPTPKATPTPAPVPVPVVAALPPLDLSDMRLWNWSGKWHASEWGNGMSPLPWKYDHVSQPAGKDTAFTLDAAGAPELQAMGGTPVYTHGLWETEVTLPKLKDGLVVAPLWLWDSNSSDEIDFEFVGRKGLDVTLHAPLNGQMQQNTVRLFAGRDMSGERHRFGIKADAAAGWVEMYLDGQRVQRWDRGSMAFFISHPLKPMISMWAADPNNAGFVSWTGKWPGLATGETLTMTVHGYKYTG